MADDSYRALLALVLAPKAATDALIETERHDVASVEAWLSRETRLDAAAAKHVAPALKDALDSLTPAGAARQARAKRG
jgi:hypothetical protein